VTPQEICHLVALLDTWFSDDPWDTCYHAWSRMPLWLQSALKERYGAY
jgi:hypothetical protein